MNNAAPAAGAAPAPARLPTLPTAPTIVTVNGVDLRPPLANVANRLLVDEDLVAARAWRSKVTNYAFIGEIADSSKAIALAEAYVTKLECLHGAPVFDLADVLAAIGDLTTKVTNLATIVHTLTTNLHSNHASLSQQIGRYGRLTALTYNTSSGNGNVRPFAVVPNAAGDDPTDPPVSLPHLRCLDDIEALSPVNRTAYCQFYGVNANGTADSITRSLAAAVGVAPSLVWA